MVKQADPGIEIEPLVDHRIRMETIKLIADWAKSRSKKVSVRLEGWRGNKPLPEPVKQSGTIEEAVHFRPANKQPYLVEIELKAE
jgi:hypothetical protein